MSMEQLMAWAAGFIDGEAHIGITKIKDGRAGAVRTHRLHPRIVVGQTNREPLERLVEIFGGTVYARSRKAMADHHRTLYVWEASGARRVATVLRAVLPLLTVKRAEAEVLLELAERITASKHGRWFLIDEAEVAARNALAARLCDVKAMGRGAPALMQEPNARLES